MFARALGQRAVVVVGAENRPGSDQQEQEIELSAPLQALSREPYLSCNQLLVDRKCVIINACCFLSHYVYSNLLHSNRNQIHQDDKKK